jgi:hypothetical protein
VTDHTSEPVVPAPLGPGGANRASCAKARWDTLPRWWAAVAVGTLVSLPIGWLLSYAAALPFFIGLYFFALFGLLIGAVTHRIAAAGRPYGQLAVLVGTTLIVLVAWGLTVVKESRDLPTDIAAQAVRRTRDLGGRSAAQFRTDVAEDVRRFLAERYPPGGTFGYMRWVLTSGQLKKGDLVSVDRAMEAPLSRLWWAVRIVLSLLLLAFGVSSQTLTLSRAEESAVRMMDVRTWRQPPD